MVGRQRISDLDDVAKGVVRAAAGCRLTVVSQTKPVRHLVPETVVPQRAALNTGFFLFKYMYLNPTVSLLLCLCS